ncbi:hypothetical protein FZEAL_2069 [Fusarium zealandicum]|uniref:PD-(D/E)XK nuclease-like domain-containing protein n=1 Tax=Fusarium zealandicum TaxID=1053134 RepID=A0A8H4URJ6_9HYPO|nr:hypothetical protein FZEAL_2069 [Fusarium zealandicum]
MLTKQHLDNNETTTTADISLAQYLISMKTSQIEAWIQQVDSRINLQDSPNAITSRSTRKRKTPNTLIDLGVSSPPLSMDSTSEPDLEATPRAVSPSKRRRLDLDASISLRQPILTPGDISPTPTRSTKTSTTGKSNRSRSPVKNMADLALAEKPVQIKQITKEADLPQDARDLVRCVKQVRRGIAIIPKGKHGEVQSLLTLMEDPLDESNIYDTNMWKTDDTGADIYWDVDYELKVLQKVAARTEECTSENMSEAAWNARVHEPLLDVALAPFGASVSHWDVTKAAMDKAYLPRHGSGIDLQSKMVDFCITLGGADMTDAVKGRLKPGTYKSINHTDYQPLRFRPIAISIETKTPDGSSQEAKAQLSVWTTAYIARLRQLAGTSDNASGLGITLPIVTVRGGQWELLFAVDRADQIEILTLPLPSIGDTTSIVDCYKVVALWTHWVWCHYSLDLSRRQQHLREAVRTRTALSWTFDWITFTSVLINTTTFAAEASPKHPGPALIMVIGTKNIVSFGVAYGLTPMVERGVTTTD